MRAYHFLSAKWALEDLEKKRLKIATFNDLNDPFELFSFDMSDPVDRWTLRMTKEQTEKETGVLCFSRNWGDPLLWSHYADKHRGVCIGFDVQDDQVTRVTYTENRLVISARDVDNASEEEGKSLMVRLLSTKYIGWQYEEEVRAYISLEEKNSSTGLYYVDFGEKLKLKEIIVGPLCSAGNKVKIKKVIGGFSEAVELIQARLAFGKFEVVKDQRGYRADQ